MLITFLLNLGLMLGLLYGYSYLSGSLGETFVRYKHIFTGLLFALVGSASMLVAWEVAPGVLLDLRTPLAALVGLLGGWWGGLWYLLPLTLGRLLLGGAGSWAGVAISLGGLGLGLAALQLKNKGRFQLRLRDLLVLGLLLALQSLLLSFVLLPAEVALEVIAKIMLPLLVGFPLCLALLGLALEKAAEQIRTQQENQKELKLLQAVINNSSAVIFVKDRQGRFLLSNSQHQAILNKPLAEILGRDDYEFFPAEVARQFQENDQKIAQTLASETIEEVAYHNGKNHTYITVKFPLLNQAGQVMGTGGIATEIDQRKSAEDAMRLAKDAAERANQAKDDFLKVMSHELTPPIKAVQGMVEQLIQAGVTPQQQSKLEQIRHCGLSLLKAVDALHDLSRLEAGKLEMKKEDFALARLLDFAHSLVEPSARAVGLLFQLEVEPGLPAGLKGDEYRTGQILSALLSNALKYTEQGSVLLKVKKTKQLDQQIWLRFEVVDTGLGMAKDQLKKIVEALRQLDASPAKVYPGLGLGLRLAGQLSHLLGGRMGVKSEQDEGSTFWVELPFGFQDNPKKPEIFSGLVRQGLEELNPQRLLVVEDDPTNQELMIECLERLGYHADLSPNGLEAVKALSQKEYDLVFMDCLMPVMDGYEATRRIRSQEAEKQDHPHLPIIAVTARAMRGDRELCIEAGMDDYLTKPVKLAEIKRMLDQFLT